MLREVATQAACRSDKINDSLDAIHITPLPLFDLLIDSCDDLLLCCFTLRKGFQDLKAVDDSTNFEIDSTAIIPFLKFSNSFGSWETVFGCCDVNVNVCPLSCGPA